MDLAVRHNPEFINGYHNPLGFSGQCCVGYQRVKKKNLFKEQRTVPPELNTEMKKLQVISRGVITMSI